MMQSQYFKVEERKKKRMEDRIKTRTPSKDWVRRCVEKCYTQDQWQDVIRSMKAEAQVDALLRVQPKLNINDSAGLQLNIIVNGVEIRPIQARVISDRPALKEHDPDTPE